MNKYEENGMQLPSEATPCHVPSWEMLENQVLLFPWEDPLL